MLYNGLLDKNPLIALETEKVSSTDFLYVFLFFSYPMKQLFINYHWFWWFRQCGKYLCILEDKMLSNIYRQEHILLPSLIYKEEMHMCTHNVLVEFRNKIFVVLLGIGNGSVWFRLELRKPD